jgi:glucosamine--fructose-6-phosphate aminotransferase (isomerizing)
LDILDREAYPYCYKGKRLEYRGYDSVGVMVYDGDATKFVNQRKVADLEEKAFKRE